MKTSGTNNQKINRDGETIAERTEATTQTIVSQIGLGGNNTAGGNPAHMKFQEMVFYDIDVLVDVSDIEINQENFYLIP